MEPDTIVVLESTTYPGTTRDVLKPILEESGKSFFVGFSPEREDPGNAQFETTTIPKIVSGEGETAGTLVRALYEGIVDKVVQVVDTPTAEAVKITENIFRAVNIALVNELKVIYDRMDIDVWKVIDGAATKPFGYMPFYPGPGLGGHCIPIDPFYLTWKAREVEAPTRFIELAGEINTNMPRYVVDRVAEVIDRSHGKGLTSSRILVVGAAYKKNVSDVRESPSMRIMELLAQRGATVEFHDPLVDRIPRMRDYPSLEGKCSAALEDLSRFAAILIATDHDEIDYGLLAEAGVPIVDTRNVFERRGIATEAVTKA
jgi:UDP-N-acetyl-D-glucosamine dehydrogenase